MVGKRHGSEEIAAKLAQANELAAEGKNQREISKALGVSIMTYHRWKKMLKGAERFAGSAGSDEHDISVAASGDIGSDAGISQLKLENSRLRRVVIDLLLEKLKLEDELRGRHKARFRRPL